MEKKKAELERNQKRLETLQSVRYQSAELCVAYYILLTAFWLCKGEGNPCSMWASEPWWSRSLRSKHAGLWVGDLIINLVSGCHYYFLPDRYRYFWHLCAWWQEAQLGKSRWMMKLLEVELATSWF